MLSAHACTPSAQQVFKRGTARSSRRCAPWPQPSRPAAPPPVGPPGERDHRPGGRLAARRTGPTAIPTQADRTDKPVLGLVPVDRVRTVPAALATGLSHDPQPGPLAPAGSVSEGPESPLSWLARPAGFEPATAAQEVVSRRGQAAAFLIRAGLLVVWLQLNVSGFRLVLARSWHEARFSM